MHRELKDLLPQAKGESHVVVVVFLDVRGFSSFAKIAESSEAALFLRSIYVKILDNYFPDASFFKLTGDGLLIILDYDESSLRNVVNKSLQESIRLVTEFPGLTSDDPMVNFDVPSALGIGIARGAATALISNKKVLDYSGRSLNIASRLMDLARPRGVVFSESLGWSLIDEEIGGRFEEEQVYVKGIAEDFPMDVYVLRDEVVVPATNKRPMNRYEWQVLPTQELTFKKFSERGSYVHTLPVEPALIDDIRVHVRRPKTTASGRKHPTLHATTTYTAQYKTREGRHLARVDYRRIADDLTRAGVKSNWPLTISIEYALNAT